MSVRSGIDIGGAFTARVPVDGRGGAIPVPGTPRSGTGRLARHP